MDFKYSNIRRSKSKKKLLEQLSSILTIFNKSTTSITSTSTTLTSTASSITLYKYISELLNLFLLKTVLCLGKVDITKIMNISNEFISEKSEEIGKAFGIEVC